MSITDPQMHHCLAFKQLRLSYKLSVGHCEQETAHHTRTLFFSVWVIPKAKALNQFRLPQAIVSIDCKPESGYAPTELCDGVSNVYVCASVCLCAQCVCVCQLRGSTSRDLGDDDGDAVC